MKKVDACYSNNALKIEKCYDKHLLNLIYKDNYINSAFGDLHIKKPILNNKKVIYYACFVNNVFVGCFLEIKKNIIDSEVHSLLMKSGLKYSRCLAKKFLKIIFDQSKVYRISTRVLIIHKKVINFCLKIGFKFEGLQHNADIKNNTFCDVALFRITNGDL